MDVSNKFSLSRKVIVITGGAGLLGRQHAEAIASAGGIPILLDVNETGVRSVAAEISDQFRVPSEGWFVDITSEQQVEVNCKTVLDRHGHIDGLVNNAANNPKVEDNKASDFLRLEKFPIERWEADLAVGLTGAFLCAKHYGLAIARNPEGGSIVNISSDFGLIAPDQRLYRKPGLPQEEQPVKPVTYSVVKTALIGLTRYLATYWCNSKTRCNTLCPGGVENNQDTFFLQEVSSRIPLGRLAQPSEYQGALIFLLSSASSYVNGAVLVVDGGRSVW